MFCLAMGLTIFCLVLHGISESNRVASKLASWFRRIACTLLAASFLLLTVTEILRGIASGTLPMANGYDTMLLIAWLTMLLSLISAAAFKKLRLLSIAFGFMLSGFFLLVSHISVMDPAIGHVMPVLNSPLLCLHVSIIMISYALLALTFVCSLTAVLSPRHGAAMTALSQVFLYPAVAALGIGIFTGAIWANVSWGNYWSWDPKETWALITLMLYVIPLHKNILPAMARPKTYHWFMLLAFLSIVMTYFGVNYFLEGMHSYA